MLIIFDLIPIFNFLNVSSLMVITIVYFKYNAGHSIISEKRIWAIVRKGCRPLISTNKLLTKID